MQGEDGSNLYRKRWIDCGRLGCPKCGPRLRNRKAVRYLARIPRTVRLYERTIDTARWRAAKERMDRAGIRYVAVPQPGGRRVILQDRSDNGGRPVADGWGRLLGLMLQLPAGRGPRATACAAWRPAPERPATKARGRFWLRLGIAEDLARDLAESNGLLVAQDRRGWSVWIDLETQEGERFTKLARLRRLRGSERWRP